MPYRRLPSTDTARLRALKILLDNNDVYTVQNRVVEWKTLSRAQTVCEKFERAVNGLRLSKRSEYKPDERYAELFQRARMYVSHFIQVLHLSMLRGEIKPSCQSLYGMSEDDFSTPDLLQERQVVEWGRKIIEGERERLKNGGIPVYNPNIAKVAVHYELFLEVWTRRRNSLDRSSHNREQVAALREEVDAVLLQLWNEIEQHFASLPPEQRFASCRKYGVVYYYRRGEPHTY